MAATPLVAPATSAQGIASPVRGPNERPPLGHGCRQLTRHSEVRCRKKERLSSAPWHHSLPPPGCTWQGSDGRVTQSSHSYHRPQAWPGPAPGRGQAPSIPDSASPRLLSQLSAGREHAAFSKWRN
jgi:hypothetical protein